MGGCGAADGVEGMSGLWDWMNWQTSSVRVIASPGWDLWTCFMNSVMTVA